MERRLGPYILKERIGAGGMGEVFRAVKTGADGFETVVAVKLILPHLAGEDRFREMFAREARFAARLKHPNIVGVSGFAIVEGAACMEMEYVQGTDLRRLIRALPAGSPLPLAESAHIIHGVARALDHAHRPGSGPVIHRDLNPHNILISTQGEVKVADFGIARAVTAETGDSATLRGKLAFMAPEQLAGKPVDHRADLFALGIIAFWLLTGRHPFDQGSEAAVINAIQSGSHPGTAVAAPAVPGDLAGIVDSLLAPDPSRRPPGAALVIQAVESWFSPSAALALGERVRRLTAPDGVEGDKAPALDATAPTVTRKTRSFPMVLAPLVLAAGLMAWNLLIPRGDAPPTGTATVPDRIPETKTEAAGTGPGPVPLEITSVPAGARVLYEGEFLGVTPLRIPAHRVFTGAVLLEKYGYADTVVRPADDSGPIHARLAALPTGDVGVNAIPWAEVWFRGRKVGTTPVTLAGVPVGRHRITLRNAALGVERTVEMEVRRGRNLVSEDLAGAGR